MEEFADKLHAVWSDENLRKELMLKGKKKARLLKPERYTSKWSDVITEALEAVAPVGRDNR